MKIGVITGIPGVGKTTVLASVSTLLDSRAIPHRVMNFGSYMLDTAISKGYVKDRDEIRKLPLDSQRQLQLDAARKIVEDAKALGDKGVALVDTHAVIRTPGGYLPGLPKYIVEIISPNVIFLIEAPPEIILKRQMNDPARKRVDYSDVNVIKETIEFARFAAMSSAVISASSVKIVSNVEGDPTVAAKSIVDIMTGI